MVVPFSLYFVVVSVSPRLSLRFCSWWSSSIALDAIVFYGALGETIASGVGSRTVRRPRSQDRGGSSLRSASQRQVSRGGSGGSSKTDGVGGRGCERGHRERDGDGVVPPTVCAPIRGLQGLQWKLWPPVAGSKPSIYHSSSRSIPPYFLLSSSTSNTNECPMTLCVVVGHIRGACRFRW